MYIPRDVPTEKASAAKGFSAKKDGHMQPLVTRVAIAIRNRQWIDWANEGVRMVRATAIVFDFKECISMKDLLLLNSCLNPTFQDRVELLEKRDVHAYTSTGPCATPIQDASTGEFPNRYHTVQIHVIQSHYYEATDVRSYRL